MKKCSIDGCEKPHYGRGWCRNHWQRWRRRGGDPAAPMKLGGRGPRPSMTGAGHHQWKGDEVSYSGAHHRVYATRGRAADNACPCGRPAENWAYDHSDPGERHQMTPRGQRSYSTDPEHYIAMCAACHKKFDLNHLEKIA